MPHPRTMLAYGNLCLKVGLYDEARTYYERCLLMHPSHGYPHFNMGLALCRAGRMDEGTKLLDLALQLKPRYGALRTISALVRDPMTIEPIAPEEVADELAEPLIIMSSNSRWVLAEERAREQNALAAEHLAAGDFKAALEALAEAIDLEPAYPEALSNLGVAHIHQEMFREAIPWLEKAVKLAPQLVSAHKNLGTAHYHLGEREAALGCYERANELRPDPRLEERIDELRAELGR